MHALGRFGGDKDIALDARHRVVGHQKTETIAMDGQAPSQIFRIVADRDKVARAKFDEMAFVAETVKCLF